MGLFGPNVAGLQKKGDVQGLMRALGHSNPEVARDALDALVGLGLAPDLLMAAVQQKAWPFWTAIRARLDRTIVQRWICTDRAFWAEAPGFLEFTVRFSGRFVQPLVAALLEGPDEVKTAALDGLRRLDRNLLEPPGAAALTEAARGLLTAASPQVRAGAVAILDVAGWVPRADSFGLLYWLEKGQPGPLARFGPPAVEPLIGTLAASLQAKDWTRAATVAAALGDIGDPRAVPALAAGVPTPACRACVTALSGIAGPEADEALLKVLRRRPVPEADALAEALLRKGEAVAPLVAQAAPDLGTDGKRIVLRLCASRRDREALRLAASLMSEPTLRADAAALLTECGFEPGTDAGSLEYCLETGDFERLVEAGADAVPVLTQHLASSDGGRRDSLVCALVRIGAPSCRALAETLQSTRSDQLEQAACDALIDIGGSEALAAFEWLLDDGKKRAAAVRGLDALGFEPGRDARGAAYHEEKGEWRACLETGPDGVGRIVSILVNGDGRAVCAALAGLAAPQLAPVVERLEQALVGSGAPVIAAGKALEGFGWVPGRDERAACYWLAKGEIERCAEVGAAAFGPLAERLEAAFGQDVIRLITALGAAGDPAAIPLLAEHLGSPGRETRVAAARAVVRLCQSCELTEAQKLAVLHLRGAITKPHADGRGAHTDVASHYDQRSWASASDCNTGSFSSHTDGVAKPGYGRHKDVSSHADEGIGLAFPF